MVEDFQILDAEQLARASGLSVAAHTYARLWQNDLLTVTSGTDSWTTHFGFVRRGAVELTTAAGTFTLRAGMYFAVPDAVSIRPLFAEMHDGESVDQSLDVVNVPARDRDGMNLGFVVSVSGHCGFLHVGGPIEANGRLRYINGCSDSLLIPPVLRGDPCLNLLHLPPGVRQSFHTHPSFRLGLVVQGSGICLTQDARTALRPGQLFFIPPDVTHCFHTDEEALVIIAFHPDSDFGPTHEDHPMINRTILTSRVET